MPMPALVSSMPMPSYGLQAPFASSYRYTPSHVKSWFLRVCKAVYVAVPSSKPLATVAGSVLGLVSFIGMPNPGVLASSRVLTVYSIANRMRLLLLWKLFRIQVVLFHPWGRGLGPSRPRYNSAFRGLIFLSSCCGCLLPHPFPARHLHARHRRFSLLRRPPLLVYKWDLWLLRTFPFRAACLYLVFAGQTVPSVPFYTLTTHAYLWVYLAAILSLWSTTATSPACTFRLGINNFICFSKEGNTSFTTVLMLQYLSGSTKVSLVNLQY